MQFIPKTLLFLVLTLFSNYLISQGNPSCDGQRYLQEVFSEVQVSSDLRFGSGVTIGGEEQELFLDVYEPEGDNAEKRPVVILAFGGSYIGGEKTDIDWLCEDYARRGYVAVSIDYRLYDLPLFPLPTELEITEVVIKSISDMKAAIRYMREDAATVNNFRIDPDNIFVGGISAGSITACHTAFLDEEDVVSEEIAEILSENGGLVGNSSDNFQYSSEVQGLVNYSGGLADNTWIDSDDPSFISFHDNGDEVVPFEDDFARIFGFDIIFMYGSKSCSDQANAVGLFNELNVIESIIHVSYFFFEDQRAPVIDKSCAFLNEIICGDIAASTKQEAIAGLHVFPNPTNDKVLLEHTSNSSLDVLLKDGQGRTLRTINNTQEIHLGDLPNAMYFLEINEIDTGNKSYLKIVKQ